MSFQPADGKAVQQAAPGALHHLRATPKTVHWGYFDAALAPCSRCAAAT